MLRLSLRDHLDTPGTVKAVRFSDFYEQIVVPLAGPAADAAFVVLRGQDGARSSLPLEDLLAPDVLLADRLNGGAPADRARRAAALVAPAHYGYKSVKHLNRIEFWRSSASLSPGRLSLYGPPQGQGRQRRAWPMGPGLDTALSLSPADAPNGVTLRTGPAAAPEVGRPR